MSWKTVSLCLCIYGVLKEFRPSESYVIPFLLGPRMNFTEEQVNNEILPIGIYATMISMIFVSLTTDWLRYKVVIVLQALCGVGVYTLLSFCTSFTSVAIVEILYGVFSATEVAYYTYTYSVVDIKYYQKVTSYTRAAHLIGRFFSGFLSQIFILTNLVDQYQLNFITLGSLAAATMWTVTLPPVKKIDPMLESQNINLTSTIENKLGHKDDSLIKNVEEVNEKENRIMSWRYIRSMCKEYNNLYVIKWSFWVITASGCFNQVSFYIQSLWESISRENCHQGFCKTTSEWNGAVDAIYTVISTLVIFVCGSITINMNKYGNLLIMVTSLIQGIALYAMIVYNSIYISYTNYIVYNTMYQALMTIASTEIAKCVNKDKHGFVFGVNNLLAVALQSSATFLMNQSGLSSTSRNLFEWYAGFCLFIGGFYLFILIITGVKSLSSNN